ncbi:ESX secretion-associated protein EspG [Nocardia sp. CA-290969]|uniref:ESX secretion-associated protein EspG n=1 Tax=Nocardia sp. CA-290969 TaxID=3239986 RepID=UPI003D89EF71
MVTTETAPVQNVWKFTGLEFFALWSRLDRGGLPFPFFYTAATHDPAKFHADRARTHAELTRRLGHTFDTALEAMAQPDIRITVDGMGSRAPADPELLVRLSGVRRGVRGYVIHQLPGETCWHSGGFTITECDALHLADTLVAKMPEYAAGTRADTVLPGDQTDTELDYDPRRSRIRDYFTESPGARATAFLAAPLVRAGSIEVEQGYSVFGPRGIARYRIDWRDLEDDGRYIVDDQVARSADSRFAVAAVNSKIAAVIQSIKNEPQ